MLILAFLAVASLTAQEPVDIGSRRELFVDRYLVDRLDRASLVLQPPVDRGSVLGLTEPWEGAFSAYFTVIHDGGVYRMYYRGNPTAGRDGSESEVTCYAESRDGISWTKPRLRIHEVRGTRENNVVLAAMRPFSHNFAPFLDRRPGVPASEKYKAIAGIGTSGLVAFVSDDAVRWRKLREEPILPKGPARYDSQNLAFWSEHERQYVLYYRTFRSVNGQNYRWISRATSKDFREWTEGQPMDFGDAPLEHLYTNQTSPYFRAPHINISIAARFFPGRQVLSADEAREIRVDPNYFKDVSDAVMFTTRGGLHYDRTFREAFLRPGVGLENWVSRTNYPAWNIVQTGPSEMSLYVGKNYGQPTAHIERYSMRLDGIASLHAGYEGGELLTRPLRFSGKQLELNFATSAAGSVRIELQDARGVAIPGFTSTDSAELVGDSIDRTVRWRESTDVSSLAGKPIRIRFLLKDADLYSFRFR